MELGDLPYDCLSCIFDCIPDLKSLLDLSTVCKEWNILAKQRLKKIRHLHVERDIESDLAASPNHLYTNDVGLMERVNVSQMFPNLRVSSFIKKKNSFLINFSTEIAVFHERWFARNHVYL
ncbi:uncharacterized protein LOC128387267 [Panonychus citri]|uniref:uncharacterized protein LOC128387267 n=1 Tax=Panonychus citri TaxID=50023 RepID=UPI00230808A4|nr:uncharacterized protein LOC128387267 [Panonychus citri]